MKKLLLALFIFTVLLSACSGNNGWTSTSASTAPPTTTTAPPTTTTAPLEQSKAVDYFPFTADVHKKFKGDGNEYAQFDSYVDYIKGNMIQIREMNGGSVSVHTYRLEEEAVISVYFQGEVYYRHDFTGIQGVEDIVIKEPIAVGTTWTLSDGSVRSISAIDKSLALPAGDYTTLEITTTSATSVIKDYYAKDIGLVKTEFSMPGDANVISSSLELYETDKPFSQTVTFYFPDFAHERLVFEEREIVLKTNEDILPRLEAQLKDHPGGSDISNVLSDGAKVLGIEPDEANGILTVDFSSELISEMIAGANFEGMLIQCIANTFGDYYQKEKVVITLEGNLYESGHFMLGEGEYFSVDHDNAVLFE
ncbi:MAG: GerMN domain-containing protein [Eubacteriales bacterium]|nr:GerMN domain-containing protein [Eubacteriales bacterium]